MDCYDLKGNVFGLMCDLTRIRSDFGGQRQAFEELVCQLARREAVANGRVFRRIEGSGGDGGIEGYELLPDGTKSGYQAKFFTRTREIDWRQIDESVEQALKAHPQLTRYVIAIPCDLTDRSGEKGRGQTGWVHWDNHKKKWKEKWLVPTNRHVEFVIWTAFELRDKLSAPLAQGLRRLWFGDIELSSTWFKEHVNLAVASLDERYHPEDHVAVAIERLFQFVLRHDRARRELRDRLLAVKQASLPDEHRLGFEITPPVSELRNAEAAKTNLLAIESEFELPSWEGWDIVRWKRLTDDLSSCLDKLQAWAWSLRPKLRKRKDEDVARKVDRVLSNLHQISEALESFQELIDGRYLTAEQDRVALIEGRAGTGKSHLLGRVAEAAAQDGRPVVLLVGQRFNEQPLWEQIAKLLGLGDIAPDEFLQAFDSAAEAAQKRGLILIDAINEGAGARLWKPEIGEFLERIRRFRNLSCIFTCRSEFVYYIIPPGTLARLQRFEIRGFETAEEQNAAAKIYLDRRGISRPSSPWLAPEFVNPLFLRSTCLALHREGQSEFPRGLSGTKAIFSFYIKSVARNLGVGRDGSDELIPATIHTLHAIAVEMAAKRKDYISLTRATEIATTNFSTFPPPDNQSWLEVLQRNGLFRYDPDPTNPPDDPLYVPDIVVRFSFQRLQDHLMAEALLADISDIRSALKASGVLSFIHDGKAVEWEWQGLAEALSIQIPERFNVELIDLLPKNTSYWLSSWDLSTVFIESIRWRDKEAFSERTLDIFNDLFRSGFNVFSLLIEFAVSIKHPWNADFLHRELCARKLPERDHIWTASVNDSAVEGDDTIDRLLDWCLFAQAPNIEREIQRLCGIILCWLCTSSNRYIRDKATKALVSLFLTRSDLFPELCESFKGIDDVYVIERLFAAAYGACCIDHECDRLEGYATATYDAVFTSGSPPLSLLLRDYARGIVELCAAKATLPPEIVIDHCRPPYQSPVPRLAVSEDQLNRIANNAGDSQILNSCYSFVGDFGRYVIEPSVDSFTAFRLTKPRPISSEEKFEQFKAEVIDIDSKRIEAFGELQNANHHPAYFIKFFGESDEKDIDEKVIKRLLAKHKSAEDRLLRLLSPAEKQRYRREADWRVGTGTRERPKDPKGIDLLKAKRWIAHRAYKLGWTSTLFPRDFSQYHSYTRQRPDVERIGKKYQWIALDELLCRLADNNWMRGRYSSENAHIYDTPLDVGFRRDIEPTIIALSDERNNSQGARAKWMLGPEIALEQTDESELAAWPFWADPGASISTFISKDADSGEEWVTLYEHKSITNHYGKGKFTIHGLRQQYFYFLMNVIVLKEDLKKLVSHLYNAKTIDVPQWSPPEFTDEPYLREFPWRDTWPRRQWQRKGWEIPEDIQVAFPVYEYRWESHLDAALQEGARALIPSVWLANALSLKADREDASLYRDAAGQPAFIGSEFGKGGSAAIVRGRLFEAVLEAHELKCLWLFVGERNAWPGGDNTNAAWRRSEGLCWLEDGKPVTVSWKRDNANGASKKLLPNKQRSIGVNVNRNCTTFRALRS